MRAKNLKEACIAIDELTAENESLRETVDDLLRRVKLVENGQGYLANREPPRIPKFPKVLREYGILPPEERAA